MTNLFDLTGKTALITGGGGVLCRRVLPKSKQSVLDMAVEVSL